MNLKCFVLHMTYLHTVQIITGQMLNVYKLKYTLIFIYNFIQKYISCFIYLNKLNYFLMIMLYFKFAINNNS